MRISTAQFYDQSAASYTRAYSNVVQTENAISSGVKLNTAADDPIGAGQLLQLGQQSASLTQYGKNISTIQGTLGQSESVLSSVKSLLQSAQEMATAAGNGTMGDSDRQGYATSLGSIQSQLLSLMNSQDASGHYIFSGSKTDTVPYTANADGTYSYNGDQTTLSLPIDNNLSMASNDTGWSIFEQAPNTSRSQTTMTAPAVDDGRVSLSNGQMSSSSSYNSAFTSGEPYTVSFVSGTQLKITDASGNDVSAEASQGGVVDPTASNAQTVSFRGVDLQLNINLKSGDASSGAALIGHSFTLESKPDTFATAGSAGNPSSTLVTGASVSDPAAYASTFPSGSAVLKFSSATTYDLYAAPITANSKPVSSGTLSGTNTATAAGVTFNLSGTPATGDQFTVQANAHSTQNILDTLSDLRSALQVPADGNPAALQTLQAAVQSGMANLTSGLNQVSNVVTSIGSRGAALTAQISTNQSQATNNSFAQSAIRDMDPGTAAIQLAMQQAILQATQLAFSKIASLSLFNSQ